MDIFFDGSLRDGRIRTCVVAEGRAPEVKHCEKPQLLTSGHSEWLAAKRAAQLASDLAPTLKATQVVLKGDYENIARHFDGQKPALCRVAENARLAADIEKIVSKMRGAGVDVIWRHVVRSENPAGVHLDATWGSTFV